MPLMSNVRRLGLAHNRFVLPTMSLMQITFHTDPVNVLDICSDLEQFGAVFIETTRTNFRELTRLVEAHGTKVLPLSTRGPDGDFHNYFLRFEDNEYEGQATDDRVLDAILRWQVAGSPLPHVERV